jgi:hypothetical protein
MVDTASVSHRLLGVSDPRRFDLKKEQEKF